MQDYTLILSNLIIFLKIKLIYKIYKFIFNQKIHEFNNK